MNFYDTCSILDLTEDDYKEEFVISSVSLTEIDNIKVSFNKSEDIKFKARQASRWLNKYINNYQTIIIKQIHYNTLNEFQIPITNDNLICISAWLYNREIEPITFHTRDNNCRIIASKIFELDVVYDEEINNKEYFTGYKEIEMTDEEMANFYSSQNKNPYGCTVNEYLLIKSKDGEIKDRRRWTGTNFVPLKFKSFRSKTLGDFKPLDSIQMCAYDSIMNNDITMLYGRAGSGKTTLPLSYIMQGLESDKIKKFYIIYHYETLKGAKTLGYVKGTNEEKQLGTASLGGILETKFADFNYFMSLLRSKIQIVPTSSLRGMEFGAEDAILCTEAQNLDVYTIKTIIQRCKNGCKQFYEGDILEQTDKAMSTSGMIRMLEVFKGYENFGCIKLQNNYRSPIGELADKL